MKIAIAGTGYVGLSNAMLLAQHNEVIAVDIVKAKVDLLNQKKSPIVDVEIEDFLANKAINFKATLDKKLAYSQMLILSLLLRQLIMMLKPITLIPLLLKR